MSVNLLVVLPHRLHGSFNVTRLLQFLRIGCVPGFRSLPTLVPPALHKAKRFCIPFAHPPRHSAQLRLVLKASQSPLFFHHQPYAHWHYRKTAYSFILLRDADNRSDTKPPGRYPGIINTCHNYQMTYWSSMEFEYVRRGQQVIDPLGYSTELGPLGAPWSPYYSPENPREKMMREECKSMGLGRLFSHSLVDTKERISLGTPWSPYYSLENPQEKIVRQECTSMGLGRLSSDWLEDTKRRISLVQGLKSLGAPRSPDDPLGDLQQKMVHHGCKSVGLSRLSSDPLKVARERTYLDKGLVERFQKKMMQQKCKSMGLKWRYGDSLEDTKERVSLVNDLTSLGASWSPNDSLQDLQERYLNERRRLAKELSSLRVPWLPDDSVKDLQERIPRRKENISRRFGSLLEEVRSSNKFISWGLASLPNGSLDNIRERINQAKMYKNLGHNQLVLMRDEALDLAWQDNDVLDNLLEAIRLGKECRSLGLPWSNYDSAEDLQKRLRLPRECRSLGLPWSYCDLAEDLQGVLALAKEDVQERANQHSRQENITLLHLKFETEHLRLSCYSRSPGASKPCRRFAGRLCSSKDIWGKGIITLKRLLNGGSPSTLVDALSAISIACAVAFVLDAMGETFGMRDEVIADIERWKMAIVDQSEQIAFTEIAATLWPRKSGAVRQSAYENSDEGHQPPWDSFERLAKQLIDRSRGFFSLDPQNTDLVSSPCKSTLRMEGTYGGTLKTNRQSAGSIPPSYDPPETLEIYARNTRSSTPYNAVEDFDVSLCKIDWNPPSYLIAEDSDVYRCDSSLSPYNLSEDSKVYRRKTGGGQSPYKPPTALNIYRRKTGGGQPPYDPTKFKGRQGEEILGVIPAATTTGGNLPSSIHDTDGLALPPEVPLDPNIDLQLPVFIMAGAIFIAILIFMNLMRISNFVRSRDGQRVQIESEWRAAAQRRLESSVKIAEEGAIGALRAEPALSCFTGIFRDAETGLKGKTLTGFSAVVDFIQVEAKIQFPEALDLRSELCHTAEVMLGQCIYHAGKENIGPHIAEFKFLLSWYTGGKDLDEIFPWREESEAPVEADFNHERDNPLNLSEQYQCTVVLPDEEIDIYICTDKPEWMDTAQNIVGSDLPEVEQLIQPQDQEDPIPMGAQSYPENQTIPCSRKRRASLVDTSDGGPSEPPTKLMKQTTIQPIICEECGKTFSRVGNLNRHNREHHTSNSIELFSCMYPGCSESFTRTHAREKHHQNRRIHPTPLSF